MSHSGVSRWMLVVGTLARSAPLATLLEAQPPDLKIAPHTLFKVSPTRLPAPLAPQIIGFFALFHPFFKNFFAQSPRQCPPCAESPRRTREPPKNPGIPR